MNKELHRVPIVLVVDDEEDLLFLIQRKLQREGFEVVVSANATRLMGMIEQSHPDIILLDINMKDISGADICLNLKSKQQTAQIPVILFSGNYNIAEIARECGAEGYITKPFDLSEINQQLTKILTADACSKFARH